MRMRPAGRAWLGLSAYVIGVDSYLIYKETRQQEGYCTMSTAFEDALRHPVRRWPVVAAWGLLTVHLFDSVIPVNVRKYEPIGVLGKKVGRYIGGIGLLADDEALWYGDA
jgi:hypothetical protein